MSNYEKALEAIDEVFGDTSVPQSETRRQLHELQDKIWSLLSSLPEEEEPEDEDEL